jgi:peptide/nickel transport system substrate-binding protein
MTTLMRKTSLVRLFVLTAAIALVVAACGTDTASPGVTGTPEPTGTEPVSPPTGAPTDDGNGTGGDLGTYTLGIFQDVTTDNQWNSFDTAGNTVWNSYFLTPMTCSMYAITYPGIELQADIASTDEIPPAEEDGDVWVAEVTLRDDVQWSDGEALTAEDVAFTWQTAVDFQLTANWADFADADVVDSVEAVDDQTVRVTFNAQPGLAQWGPGTGVANMPIMPEHFWAPVVEEAAATDDQRTELISASGAEAPSCGPTVFSDRQEGSFAASTANDNWHDAGAEQSSGDATWTDGPYADEFQYPLYGGQEAAVLALANGEVDLLLNPLGMQRGFQDQVAENEDLTAIVNPTNGFRFMAFNHARAPMSDPAFRDALTALIDKEFVTEQLLQGVAFPLYVILPEGNTAWYNEEAADQYAEEFGYRGLDQDTRRQTAIDLLTEAGYTWETAPEVGEEGFTGGQGLIDPEGNPVPQLELVTPTASYDPLRATFGNYISGVAQEMGIPVVSIPTDFNKIVADVFETDPDDPTIYVSNFDMFILGYSLGNAAFPTFHGSFFATGGDSNNTQYSSEEYDAASAAFDSAQTEEEAYEAMWEMERLIARDKPHVPLFDTGILEFYNNRVQYPFEDSLSGLQFLSGLPASVQAR